MTSENSSSYFDDLATSWDEEQYRIDRANAVAAAMRNGVPLSSLPSCMEYGCGTGLLSFALLSDLKSIVLADSSEAMLTVLRKKIAERNVDVMQVMKLDLTTDPVPDLRFHLIFSLMTLHHVVDTNKILNCFAEMIEPGGFLCIADLDAEDGSFHGNGFTGHNGFDRNELEQRVRSAGFNNVQFQTVFEIVNSKEIGQPKYPIFLLIAQKP